MKSAGHETVVGEKAAVRDLLQVRNLKIAFALPEGRLEAVRNVSFRVPPGGTVALVGESGSGKSVVSQAIMGILPKSASIEQGEILFADPQRQGEPQDIAQLKPNSQAIRAIRGGRISVIFQEPMTSLSPVHTVGDQVSEALHLHRKMSRREGEELTAEMLRLVGFPDPKKALRTYPFELSGGLRQRAMIAIALANEPDLLIADEPTTALDVTIQAQILELIESLRRRLGMALLLITHDLGIVRKMAERVYVMKAGEIVECGRTADVFAEPSHDYTRHLLAAQPSGEPLFPRADAPVVMAGHDVKVWFPLRGGLLRRTSGYVKAVDRIDIEVRAGQTVGVVGESGSGKTTLGLALLKLQACEGAIVFSGQDLQAIGPRALRPLRRQMQIVFQDPYGSLSPRMSVGQIVGEGLRVHRLAGGRTERERLICEALGEVGLDPEFRHRYPHEFSGGQRQRIAIARAMILKPRFLVLDRALATGVAEQSGDRDRG